jgi:lysophospholipase L1-like esterase
MKPLTRFILAALFAALLPSSTFAQSAPIRIMPLGDSITDGTNAGTAGRGGYRGTLYDSLTTAGYNVDYIGSLSNNGALLADVNHEGHSGWRIDQLDANIEGWFNAMEDPDVVLMHIGTNDFGQGVDITNAINRLDALILKIATLRPYAHIIVTNLMERGEPRNTEIQTHFNPFVEDRVDAHALAGRRVTFLDMRAAVPITDMPDNLHPNQTGYDKMAAAWLPAIQAVIGVDGDSAPPAIVRARGVTDLTQVKITFSKPVADSAATPANFLISGGLAVTDATLAADKRSVTLTTSAQDTGTTYTITINGVEDRLTPTPNPLAANSTVEFQPVIPRGYLNHVPEAAGYTLAATLDIPNSVFWRNAQPAYSLDNRGFIGAFDRVAYYVELQSGDGQLRYLWASMDAFTSDVSKIAVPTLLSGAQFQQAVTHMNVVSNAAGIVNGTGLTGNLEFWPTNYQAANGAGVSGASGTAYDFGDTPTPGTYGSMQLHHAASGQTLFALNNWGAATGTPGNLDLGIGNDPAPVNQGFDWTFHHNAADYTIKSLQVLVRTSGDLNPPAIVSAAATFGGSKVTVSFSEPLAPASIDMANFSLDGGVSILGFTLQPNQRDLVLLTTPQPSGSPLTLTVSGIRDTSPNANLIPANSTIAVAAAALPPEIVANVGAPAAGYHLVYSANLPTVGNFVAAGSDAYTLDDSAAVGPFTRVAYYLELQQGNGPVQYVWASMDAFTINRGKLGIPTFASGAVFQRNVTNLDVRSNVAGVTTGASATGGNIEFWPHNYSAPNELPVANASATTFDTGDTRSTSGNYGSMQIHNHDSSQTLLAVNHFGADGNVLDVGIGNNPAPVNNGVDWTFAANAGTYSRRVLHVLVLPGTTTDPVVVANAPESADYQLVHSLTPPTAGNLVSGTGFTNYSVNHSADVGGFSRVAYYMELQKTGDAVPRHVWVSMDAFTTNAARIGVPTPASGAVFQQILSNMNVVSNVPGVVNGSGIATGNIEFWPNNYSQPNAIGIPNASSVANNTGYDFGDTRSTTGSHGSMQIHNHGASQTLFGISNWGSANNGTNVLAMGIGNNPTAGQAPDYTLSANGTSWDIKRLLQVYVLPTPADVTPPTLVRAVGSTTRNRLIITFSEPLADDAANPANYSVAGLTVERAELLPGKREVAVFTSAQTAGGAYTVEVSGVRDRSPQGNGIASGANVGFTAYSAPAALANVPETSGYELVYQLAIPDATPRWNFNTIPYGVEEPKYGERLFDRVAYLMELDSNWVYASFDRHTGQLAKTGVPTLGVTATPFQQLVANMNVASNVPGIVTGDGISTGNIEFWGGNYAVANALAIPGASATTHDFGDTMTAGGHACMQIHNHGAGQVVMAYNNWGANSGQVSETGIGNSTGAHPDWTFSSGASLSTVRNLYVLVRPGGSAVGSAPEFYSHPISRSAAPGGTTTFAAAVTGTAAVTWQWRKDGEPIVGENRPWLVLAGLSAANDGVYDVVATGANLVSATSRSATLVVEGSLTFAGYGYGTLKNQPATLGSAAILAAASGGEGPLSITAFDAVTAQGGSVATTAGGLLYTPAFGFAGTDSFGLTIGDGSASVGGTVTLTVSDIADPFSFPTSIVSSGPGTVDIGFHGIPGRRYEVSRSVDLFEWTPLETLTPAANGTMPFEDPEAPAGKAFYRSEEAP